MRKLTTLFFAISLLLVSCGGTKSAMSPTGMVIENRYFSDAAKDYVYKTNIAVYGNEMSGILIVKKTADATHRLVLTTDFGNKLMDVTMKDGVLSVNSIVEEFDRKILVKTLEKDFGVLLRQQYPVFGPMDGSAMFAISVIQDESFEITEGSHGIDKIIRSERKPKAEYTFTSESDTFAREISILHHDLKLKIQLHAIEK